MKKRIKSINALSAAKVLGIVYGFFGTIVGIAFLAIELLSPGNLAQTESAVSGLAVLLLAPIIYGAIGAICGGAGAFFYNFISEHIGGLEIELE